MNWIVLKFHYGLRTCRKPDPEGGALPQLAFDLESALVTLDDAEDHRKPKASSTITLCREKRFEATLPHFRPHAGAGIDHFHDNVAIPAVAF